MKLEVGQFVRTKKGIFQVRSNNTTIENKIEYVAVNGRYTHIDINTILKASHNIIELIEVGDYVNGCKVHRIANCITIILDNEENISWVKPSDIKSIVTKEQFESMEYRIGE